ncbi:MAG: HU family DNA-binding protein [Candidatus Kapaibacterium sp.]
MSLNKTDLITNVAEKADMTKVNAEKAINATLESISEELAAGGNVTLIGFGTFSVYERSARKGKNPRTGETIDIPEKKVPKFKPGKSLSEAVDAPKKKAKKKKSKK